MRPFLVWALTLLVLSSGATHALAQAPAKPSPTVVVVPPPGSGSPSAATSERAYPPPTSVVVLPPPPGYTPDAGVAPKARVRERDESKYGYYPPPNLKPRLKSGMLITGIWITGWSYGLALIVGSAIAGGEGSSAEQVGVPLMVPVIGPFIAAANANSAKGVLIAMGVSEVIGASLLAGGIYKYRKSKGEAREQGYRVDLGHGKTIALDLTVSPALFGPKLDLRF